MKTGYALLALAFGAALSAAVVGDSETGWIESAS
jgi:hypothetical protein